jgi:diguanylate cyclase (GGDEF)-like protein
MFMDLDNFKSINDTQGHGAGDLLLIEAALRLKACIRQIDSVARFGGDELVVLLNELPSDRAQARNQAELVAEKIRSVLSKPYVLQTVASEGGAIRSLVHNCTVSIGVALFMGQENPEEDVLKWADLAMYKAKDSGRNTVCFFDSLMQIENTSRVVLEEDLREAIRTKQFSVYYQAQVTGKREITGVEALLRWQHPTRGWVAPAEFIPKAEKTGLIVSLGLWALEAACTQLARWSIRPEMANLTMAINTTARQFHQADFVDQVLAVLARTGANPKQIKLELTESMLITDVESVITKMKRLKDTGISFSLDDFGTGYSSLSSLKRLPLEQLKIAQEFVRDILIDPNDMAIARMVVALADSMDLLVIAEGVETEEQREFLAGLGCHHYQGYLFSQALPAPEFEALLARR